MALDIKATLRVFSKKHTLLELNSIIGDSSNGFSLGDDFSKGTKRREHTCWSFKSSSVCSSKNFDDHLVEVLNYCEIHKNEISKLRKDHGCIVNVFCMFSSDNGQGGGILSANVMEKLSKLNLDLIFDVYAE